MSRQAVRARIRLFCAAVNLDLTAFCDAHAAVYSLPDAERDTIMHEFTEVFA